MKGYYKQGSNGGPHGLHAFRLEEGPYAHGGMLLCLLNHPPSIPDSDTAIGTSSFRPWKNIRVSGWTLKNWHHSTTCVMWPSALWTALAVTYKDGLHTKWIRAQSYYHWKVAELHQLQHCPHLQGLPVPPGPMECLSVLQQPQRPNRQGAAAPGTSGSSRVGGLTTSVSHPGWRAELVMAPPGMIR